MKKDSRFHKLATVMDKAEDAVDKKAPTRPSTSSKTTAEPRRNT
ncbi:hypothetical protein ACFRMN_05755 [Streptomyces sp. NPDC056835]